MIICNAFVDTDQSFLMSQKDFEVQLVLLIVDVGMNFAKT
jgi:hypothetical protein